MSKPYDSVISEVQDGCYSPLTEKPKQQSHSQLQFGRMAVCLFRVQALQLVADVHSLADRKP